MNGTQGPSPRTGHSLTAINSNEFFLFGGASHEEGIVDDAFILDTRTFQWTRVSPSSTTAALPPKRYDHASLCYNGNVLIFGGSGEEGLLNDLWSWNKSDGWKCIQTTNPPKPRTIRDVCVINEKLCVFGGGDIGSRAVDDPCVWFLDMDTWEWSNTRGPLETSPSIRFGHSLVSYNNKMYVFGGMNESTVFSDLWEFNGESGEWTEIVVAGGPKPKARSGHACDVFNGKLYIHGGLALPPQVLDDVWALDLDTFKWAFLQKSVARLDSVLRIVDEKTAVVFGGMDLGNIYNDIHKISIE